MILVSTCAVCTCVCECFVFKLLCLPIDLLEGEETFSLQSLSKLASYTVFLGGGRGVIGMEDRVQKTQISFMLMV